MKEKLNFDLLKKQIADGETKHAIVYLKNCLLSSEQEQALTLIEADFSKMKAAEIKGLITFQELNQQRSIINNRLLELATFESLTSSSKTSFLKWLLIPIFLAGCFFAFKHYNTSQEFICPSFGEKKHNKILVLPFENVGHYKAKPELVLCDRINQLTSKNNLSTAAKALEKMKGRGMDAAKKLSRRCDANVIVWGTYSSRNDSIRLVLHYYFKDKPKFNSLGLPVQLKDVTGLQSGKMLKELDDAILSLCGLLAVREGNIPIATKWFKKLNEPEKIDKVLLEKISHNK